MAQPTPFQSRACVMHPHVQILLRQAALPPSLPIFGHVWAPRFFYIDIPLANLLLLMRRGCQLPTQLEAPMELCGEMVRVMMAIDSFFQVDLRPRRLMQISPTAFFPETASTLVDA